jgi:hypothetical protein
MEHREHTKSNLINYFKIISNIFLGVMLLLAIITIALYNQEAKEVIVGKEPIRFLEFYEEKTNTKCFCSNEMLLFNGSIGKISPMP